MRHLIFKEQLTRTSEHLAAIFLKEILRKQLFIYFITSNVMKMYTKSKFNLALYHHCKASPNFLDFSPALTFKFIFQ